MRKAKVKSIVLVLLVMVSVSLLFGGCGSSNTDGNASTTTGDSSDASTTTQTGSGSAQKDWEMDTSPITLNEYFYASWGTNYPWQDGQYVAEIMKKKTGVTADITLPTGNDSEYLNVMIAGGDLPDIMVLEWYNPITQQLIKNGMIYSINELAEKYAPGLMPMIPSDIINYHKQDDGKLYYLPSFFNSKDAYDKAEIKGNDARPFFVRKDIYEALGSPKMNTPDEWVSVLKQVKEKYPEVIPFGTENPISPADPWDTNLSFTSYIPQSFNPEFAKGMIEGDRLLLDRRTPGWKEGLQFMRRLYSEGLFPRELFTDKADQYKEKLDNGKYFMASRFVNDIYGSHNQAAAQNTGDPNKVYMYNGNIVLKVDGKDPVYKSGSGAGWVCTMVTTKCQKPDRAIRFIEYLWSDEGQMDNFFGTEGETYETVDGIPKFKQSVLDEYNKDGNAWTAKYGFESKAILWRSEFNTLYRNALAKPEQLETFKELSKYTIFSAPLGLEGLDPSGDTQENVIKTKTDEDWAKTVPKLIMAKSDDEFNKIWDEAMKTQEKLGVEQLEKFRYQKHLEDLKRKGY